MMKIVHVISDTRIGGAGRYLLALLPGARCHDWQVTVIAPSGQLLEAVRQTGLCHAVIPMPRGEVSFSQDLWRWLKRHLPEADVVHTHASLAGRLAARQRGSRVVLTRHTLGPDLPSRGLPGWKRLAHRLTARLLTDGIIAVSEATRQRLLDEGVDGRLINLVYHGVDAIPYLAAEGGAWRRRLGLTDDLPVIITVARLTPVKGLPHAVDAARRLRAAGQQFHWLLVGHGPEEARLRQQIAESGLNDHMRLLGWQQDIPGLLAAADVFVLPSLQEALGLSVLEAMAAGLPVVASNVGGIPELITPGEEGSLVPPGAAAQLADAISPLLSQPVLRRRWGQQARAKVLQQFTLQEMWRRTDTVYRQVQGIRG